MTLGAQALQIISSAAAAHCNAACSFCVGGDHTAPSAQGHVACVQARARGAYRPTAGITWFTTVSR